MIDTCLYFINACAPCIYVQSLSFLLIDVSRCFPLLSSALLFVLTCVIFQNIANLRTHRAPNHCYSSEASFAGLSLHLWMRFNSNLPPICMSFYPIELVVVQFWNCSPISTANFLFPQAYYYYYYQYKFNILVPKSVQHQS